MINITRIPENLSSVFMPVNYTLTSTYSSDKVEVEIYDETKEELLGVKRYSDENEYTVEVSEYLQYRFNIEPSVTTLCELYADTDKLKGIAINTNDSAESIVTYHTFSCVNNHINSLLSSAPNSRLIAWDQRDEHSVLVDSGTVSAKYIFSGTELEKIIELESLEVENSIVTLVTDMKTLYEILETDNCNYSQFDSLELSISIDNQVISKTDYTITETDSSCIRLCWLNKHGALDYYNFTGEVQSNATIKKERIYSYAGYIVTGSELSRCTDVYSDFVTNDTILWLSEILASPMVWIDRDNEFFSIDIVSESTTYQSDDLLRLSISFREVENEIFQHI